MKKSKGTGVVLIILLLFSSMYAIQYKTATARVLPNISSVQLASKVAIITGNENSDQESELQIRRMLENKGLIYETIRNSNQSELENGNYSLIIVLGSTKPQIAFLSIELRNKVEKGTGLIWVGENLPASLNDLFSITYKDNEQFAENTINIDYENSSTQLFTETVEIVESLNASIKGSFIDNNGDFIGPAELSFKKDNSGQTYFFAYDVCSWWFADQENPWLRAYRLHLAIEDILSTQNTVRLSPYPKGMQSVFAVRIEDVDPLHTNPDWIKRANDFLNYYSSKNAPLTVALTPTYVDPESGLNFGIEENSAQNLKDWLSKNLMNGGTIIEHGYTHQIGNQKTGVSPEFFDPNTQTWLSLENQKLRIETGEKQILNTLGFQVKGFESPHYIANNDTYKALSELGFKYVTQNTNTAFIDQYELSEGVINVPETLGYIPNDAPENLKDNIISNMQILKNMSGVMLYFNHLFDDQMSKTGEELLNYATKMGKVWITNSDNIADFSLQRLNAYQKMSINSAASEKEIVVKLGPSNRAGLTLTLDNTPPITFVTINGIQWTVFEDNQVILPSLADNTNSIVIGFEENKMNTNQFYGYALWIATFIFSLFLISQIFGIDFFKKNRIKREKW